MSVLENFKNIPRSPYGGATGLKCNSFSSNLQRRPWRKKRGGPVAPPTGDRPLSPTPGATDQWAQPTGARGAGRPSRGRPGQPSLYKASPLIPSSFDLKKSKEIQKKERGEEKGSGEALPNSALVIYR